MEESQKVPQDDTFVIHVSGSMDLRNQLRTGLVEAQQKDTAKVPLFVSWPDWLDDGIVCLYAKDFRQYVRKAIKDAARAVMTGEDVPETDEEDGIGDFQAMVADNLEHLKPGIPAAKSKPRTPPRQPGFENDGIPEGLL